MSRYKVLSGAGGDASSATTPTSVPDSLRSQDTVEFLIGLGEGPIVGPRNGNKDVFLGGTALERADGTTNFTDVKVNLFQGEPSPAPVTFALGGSSNNHSVGVPLASQTPVSRQTTSGAIDYIQIRLVVASLYKNVIGGSSPGIFTDSYQFRIRYKPTDSTSSSWTVYTDAPYLNSTANPYYGGYLDYNTIFNQTKYTNQINWATSQQSGGQGNGYITIDGKTTSSYVKEYRIPVQRTANGYTIEVTQISADSDDPTATANGTYHIKSVSWESFQEINSSPQTYPNTAMLQLVGKASNQFSSIPQISSIQHGLIVRVPTNYNPLTWTYTGVWDGTWQYAWTNNPVWLLYEAISNTRWGWSTYTPVTWSQYEAYTLAQYCDTLILNPQGVMVPRYTFNIAITDPVDGRDFCRMIAGSFNSVIVDDNNGNIHVLMDKNDDAIALVGKESIIGDFQYTYTDINTRYNDITAVFLNPDINYDQDRRRINNQAAITQFGRIPYDFVCVGCTNEWEAIRKATRRLVQSQTEREMVNFKTNRRAEYWTPYDVILVADTDKAQGYSGRFQAVYPGPNGGTKSGDLRDAIYLEAGATYQIIIQDKDQIYTHNLTNPAGTATTLTWDTELPTTATITANAQFALSQSGDYGIPKPYRILNCQNGDGPDDWSITAIELNRAKFAAEDTATQVGSPQYIFTKETIPADPTNVVITNTSHLGIDGTFYTEFRIDFTPPDDDYVTNYLVRYKLTSESEWTVQSIHSSGEFIETKYAGVYEAQVQSENVWQQTSNWIAASGNVTTNKATQVSGGTILSATGGLNQITLKIIFPNQSDISAAQVYKATSDNQSATTFVGNADATIFVDTGLGGSQSFYYWVKFVDNQGNIGPFSDLHGVLATTTLLNAVDISAGAVTTSAIASGAITSTQIASQTILGSNIYNGAVTSAQIAAATITAQNLRSDTLVSASQAAGIAAIPVVGSLPNASSYTGTQPVLYQNQLYQIVSGAWVATAGVTNFSQLQGLVAANQIASGAVTAQAVAAASIGFSSLTTDLQPPQVVSSLPSTSGYTGSKIVFNTADGKLYRLVGSAWTSTTAATDVVGSLAVSNIPGLDATKIISGQFTSSQIASVLASTVNGTLSSANIGTGTITSAKMAAGLSVPLAVSKTNMNDGTVTSPAANSLAYNSSDGKMYRNPTSGATSGWVVVYQAASDIGGTLISTQIASVAASTVTGTLTSSQIASVLASAVSGTLPAAQVGNGLTGTQISAGTITGSNIAGTTITGALIAANTIVGSNLVASTITATQIASGTITASKIATGTITASQIASGTITATQIAANTIAAGNIVSATITSTQIAASTILGGNIAAGAITAGNIAAGTITATQIAAGTITANNLVAGTITAAYIAAGAIGTTQLAANSVTAGNISAGSITASKLTLTDTTNMVADANVTDTTGLYWTTVSGSASNWTQYTSTSPGNTQYWGSNGVIQITSGETYVGSGFFKVNPGDSLYASCKMYLAGTGSSELYIFYYDSSGASASLTQTVYNTTSGVWLGPLGGSSVVPATAAQARLVFVARSGNSSFSQFGQPCVYRMANANLIVNGSITAVKLVANSITAGQIAAGAIGTSQLSAGAVTATQIAAGTISADKMAIGLGTNLLWGSDQSCDPRSFIGPGFVTAGAVPTNTIGYALNGAGSNWSVADGTTYQFYQTSASGSGDGYLYYTWYHPTVANKSFYGSPVIVLQPGMYYEISGYCQTHRCDGFVNLVFCDSNNNYLGEIRGNTVNNSVAAYSDGLTLAHSYRSFACGQAPPNTAYGYVRIVKGQTNSGSSDSYLFTNQWQVVATGSVTTPTTVASPWSPPGVTLINGGSLISNSITATQIAAASITADRFAASNITVALNVGTTGKIILDGANNRILITD